VGPAIRLAQTARHIVLTTNALPALKIGIAVMMSSVKTTAALDLKRSVSGIKIAQGRRLCVRRGAALSAVLIAIVRMGKLVVITGVREGKRMNAVTMPIAQSVNNALIGAVSTILMPVPLIKIVRRIRAAKAVAV
jgi:hypothetical protein